MSPPPPESYGAPAMPAGMSPWGELASWPIRVQSALVDWAGPGLVAGLLYSINEGLGWVAWLVAFGWALYNAYLGGTTGQSYGKKWAGTRVIKANDGQLLGGGLGIGRYILHILDALPCYLGYLWPLWDAKRQTFADKIVSTVVVKV
jgi:uncharacterized RDD family membrane protein YckC